MKVVHLSLLTLVLVGVTSVAEAAGNQKKACVDASTKGQTERDAGHLLEARTQFLQCASDECPAIVRKSCDQWLADVEERIPSVVVTVLDASGQDLTDARLSIDGQPVELDGRPVQLDPGPHTLLVTHPSGAEERKTLLAEKEKARLIRVQLGGEEEPLPASGEMSEAATPDSPPADSRDDGAAGPGIPAGVWALGGVGIAGLGAFTYFALTAKGEYDDLEGSCSPGCTDSQTQAGRTNALLADISLGVGAAALVGAVTWLIIAKKKKPDESRASIGLAPSRAGATLSISGRY
jgi:hypothetical protein